ncbi:hypothetical protein D9757_013236 [Collybiopsis confluens]|uniref:WD40 repeat-like protein n=1 Tax=Collybiopsis confluens TaxID=2823264 RepID=A0A8H5D2E7_9AGAR|nr:hypothetical protein D9757_013236 [Collybiopsis confluens]
MLGIVSGSGDQTIRIWDATTGTQIGESLEGHDAWVQSVAFSPDGTRIVSGSDDQTIRIWDATTGNQIGESLEGHDAWVQSVAFSPDGTRIVSGSHDQTIRIWDATTGTQIGESLNARVQSLVAFSSNGTRIFPNSGDKTICHHPSLDSMHWFLHLNGSIHIPNISTPLLWIPSNFRNLLWTPQTTCIISRTGYFKLSFNNCQFGPNWAQGAISR